jgi:sugar lactone lactonase YvrE
MAPRRSFTRSNYLVFAGFILAALAICALSAVLIVRSFQGERKEPFPAQEGIIVETLVKLPGDRAYPEAVTLGTDGYLYSGSFCTGELWRISPQGKLETWLKAGSGIAAVSGMAFDSDGILYVVDHGNCDPRHSVSSIKRVLPDKTVESWGEVNEDVILNGLTFDANGVLYATDTQRGEVLTFDEQGSAAVWWELPSEPNDALPTGITYDPNNNALVIADSGNGIIYRVAIGEDGQAGVVQTLFERSQRALDGLTLDDQGRVIFTSFDDDRILRLEPTGETTILARDFRDPSDVVYQAGRIYVTNFDGVSLAPFISLILDPSLPFTIDVIDLTGVDASGE